MAQAASTSTGNLPYELETERLLLRNWRPTDLDEFVQMNADPTVMRYYPASLTAEETAARGIAIDSEFYPPGFRAWCIEVKDGPSFAGMIGLKPPPFEAAFTPCIEAGWRLGLEHWGKGYATEAARAVFRHGFTTCDLEEIVAFTAVVNERSWLLMERLGMTRDPDDDFDHPLMPVGHELEPHVLYRINRKAFLSGEGKA